jgi:cell division protein FtsW (lipid II flippase)
MSYGGSSLISVMMLLGLILRVDHENRQGPARSARDRGRP